MILRHYIRNNRNQPTALLVGTLDNGKLKVGWSAQNQAKEKNFYKADAINLAEIRLFKHGYVKEHAPKRVHAALPEFLGRMERYYHLGDS